MTSSNRQKKNTLITGIIAIALFLCYAFYTNFPFKTELRYEKYNNGYKLLEYTQGFNDKTTAITLPSQYEGKNVVAIDDKVFYKNKKITSVVIPETVTEIGASVFKGCKNLQKVVFGNNVTYIGGECFKDCSSLTEVFLPDSVTELKGETFMGCSSLKNVTLPKNITEIRGNTFENCTSLENIIIPNGVTRIAAHAFYGCSSLSNVFVPDTVKEIGSSAFRLCENLQEIGLPKNISINERAFKESPTKIIYKNFTDEERSRILEEINSQSTIESYVVKKKNTAEDEITYENNSLLIANSPKFAEVYTDYETKLLQGVELTEYLKNAKSKGCTSVTIAMYSKTASEIKGTTTFIFSDPMDIDTAISNVIQE